ncbi:MAG: SpoIID/LytB domain-containing protein [Spirochaetota bacterium]
MIFIRAVIFIKKDFIRFIILMKNNKSITLTLLTSLTCFLLVYLSCTPSKKYIYKQYQVSGIDKLFIRILLKKTEQRVLVSSRTKFKITDKKTGKIIYSDTGKDIYYEPGKIDNAVLIESWGSPLSIDGDDYRGMIELHNVLGKMHVINVIQMNEYLYSVVPGEIVSSWDSEALKAQAVAARTYTYHHLTKNKKSLFDLDSTSNFQVYKGVSVEKESTTAAVNETSGKVAFSRGKPIVAFFHSTCGGRTTDDRNVWSGDGEDYLKSVSCSFCKDSPYYSWEEKLTLYDIKQCLGRKYKSVGPISGISFERKGNRVFSAVIQHKHGTIKLTGNELRLLFPEKKIKSMFFSAKKVKDGLILSGHGWGHGVGMCQWGAKGMAEKGAGYKEILKYYYRGVSIRDAGQKDYAGR